MRPGCFYYREIEHIHHLSIQESCIASVGRKKLCHLGICGCTEYFSVEKAVKDISYCPYKDKSEPHKNTCGGILSLDQSSDVNNYEAYQHNSKEAQSKLPDRAAKLHTKRHAVILYKADLEPVSKYRDALPYCKKNTTYPAWHPEGRYIAFSSNTTHQVFFGEGQQPIEVYDTASDLVVYDTETGDVITDPRFTEETVMETFPGWSPDGKYLYYSAADARDLPNEIGYMQYHMMRVGFDPQTGRFDERIDTLYNAYERQGSVSYPRISPDGKYLLYTHAIYGTFPIWHPEADLQMIDLQTGEDADVAAWNDADHADSYHSWSSNGRWVMFGSRRLDGRYTRLYIAYLDEDGKAHKPFLLPQEDPRHNTWRLKSFNVPEFIDGKVKLSRKAADLFYSED